MILQLAVEIQSIDWGSIIVQSLITVAAVFGGAGFWQYKQSKLQAKRDAESKKTGVERKVDTLTDTVGNLNSKVDQLSSNVVELRNDIELLQLANEETIRYRNSRDTADKAALQERRAIVDALRGMIRERLLDVYKQCMKKGYYTKEERETYGELFNCYENSPFDGNGVMHQLRPIMQALPWTAEDAGVVDKNNSED